MGGGSWELVVRGGASVPVRPRPVACVCGVYVSLCSLFGGLWLSTQWTLVLPLPPLLLVPVPVGPDAEMDSLRACSVAHTSTVSKIAMVSLAAPAACAASPLLGALLPLLGSCFGRRPLASSL